MCHAGLRKSVLGGGSEKRSSAALPIPAKSPTTPVSNMNKKMFSWALLVFVVGLSTGCNAIKNYSIRSYQGPLPLEDYRYMHEESYGVPLSLR